MPSGIYTRTELNSKNALGHKHSEQSRKMMSISHTGLKQLEETKRKISQNHSRHTLGKHFSVETKNKMSIKAKLRRPNFLGKTHSQETKEKFKLLHIGQVAWNKGKKLPQFSGINHPNWQGGITSINAQIRNSLEMKLWRKAIFERDNYACIWCGNNKSGNLNADHIKPFALYPELRFAIDNGRTLCVACHKTTDSYLGNFNKNYKK